MTMVISRRFTYSFILITALTFSTGCGVDVANDNTTSDTTSEPATTSGPPINVSAVAGDGQIIISWSAPTSRMNAATSATTYNLYMATENGVNKANYTSKAGGMKHDNITSPFTHPGLTNGSQYYLVVTAVSDGVESAESGEVSATPAVASGGGGGGGGGGASFSCPAPVNPAIAGLFPDGTLQACVSAKGWVNANDASGQLDCSMKNDITDLTGMEYLTGLNNIDLSVNNISDVGPLSCITGLKELFIDNNKIVDVSQFKTLVNLDRLWVFKNLITTGVDTLAGVSWVHATDFRFYDNPGIPCAHLDQLRTTITDPGWGGFVPQSSDVGSDCT